MAIMQLLCSLSKTVFACSLSACCGCPDEEMGEQETEDTFASVMRLLYTRRIQYCGFQSFSKPMNCPVLSARLLPVGETLLLNMKSESKIGFLTKQRISHLLPLLSCLTSVSLSLGTRFSLFHRLYRDQQDLCDCSACKTAWWDL